MSYSSNRSDPIFLSVRLMTFNHGKFIEDALLGIDNQKTNFKFELVIGDDFSQDDTVKRIKNFEFSNPNLSVNLLHRKPGGAYHKLRQEKGRLYNFSDIVENCQGKYIALLDGDDYWIDPLKLQKQIDFLEENIECSFCFHKTYKKLENQGNLPFDKIFPENLNLSVLNASQFLKIPTIGTCSVVFRNQPIRYLKELSKHSHGDFLLYCDLLEIGKAGFINENMSVYRKHSKGISYDYASSEYLFNRIKELKIECKSNSNHFISEEISRIRKEHIIRFLKLYQKISSIPKILFLYKELICNKFFYIDLKNKFRIIWNFNIRELPIKK